MPKPDQKMYQSGKELYRDHFKSREYLEIYTADSDIPFLKRLHECWLDKFASGAMQGKRFLDFGCGPCINLAIPASKSFDELYLCDFVAENRQFVKDWVEQKPTAHDWTQFLQLTADREGGGVTCADVAARVRQKIKQVWPCDVHITENPFHPNQFEPGFFDCIVSNLCLNTACSSEEHFQNTINKLATYLKPSGHLAIGVPANSTFYSIGDNTFFDVTLQCQNVEKAFREAGFVNVQAEMVAVPENAVVENSDTTGPLFAMGMKK